jgi:hypothetical protein
MQSVSITTKIVSLNPVHGEVYSIQYYVIKLVRDLRQVGDFHRILRFPPQIKHHKPNIFLRYSEWPGNCLPRKLKSTSYFTTLSFNDK